MSDLSATHNPGAGKMREVFFAFLKLGVTSFGGPTAHLGYFREEFVVRRKWLTESQYAELVTLSQLLPGPGSSQVGFAIGLGRAGYRGALAAWLAFTLPSALLLVLFASSISFLENPLGQGMLAGLKAVAAAVVAHAVWGMARQLTPDVRRIIIGVLAFALVLLLPGLVSQLSAIALGAVGGLVFCRRSKEVKRAADAQANAFSHSFNAGVTKRAATISLSLLTVILLALPVLALTIRDPLLQAADAFTRAGALVFGGGHVVLPLLQSEPWVIASVNPDQLLAGYAAAQAVPGPLFTFAGFLGNVATPGGGWLMAAVALVAVFIPGLLLIIGVLPFWARMQKSKTVRAATRGTNAAVVGILAAALYNPIITEGINSVALALAAVGCLLLLILKIRPWIVVLAGAAAGALFAVI